MNRNNPSSAPPIHPRSAFGVVALVCLVAVLSYLAAKLGGTLVLRPEMIWPVWPGCAFLLAVLLLTPRKIWLALLIAGLSGFALYDAQERLPVRATSFLLVADSIEILVAALGVFYVFGGTPRLNNIRSLAKYSFFAVILAPVSVASAATLAFEGDSWWVGFFTEALALLTLTPAILGWAEIAVRRVKKPKTHYLEAASMCFGLAVLSYFTFVRSGSENRPALLYSLVPFLLWAALRFGVTGTSSTIVLVSFPAVLGAIHKHGPFTGNTPVHDVLSLQLFLLVAGSSFMVLAAVVEDDKASAQAMRKSEEELRASEARLNVDIAERRLVEEKLREYEKAVEGAEDMIGVIDREYRFLLANRQYLKMRNLTSEQVIGHFVPEVLNWEVFETAIKPQLDECFKGNVVKYEMKFSYPTLGERDLLLSYFPIEGVYGIDRAACILHDITDRKRAEEALVELNRTLEAQSALLQSSEELLKIFVKNVPAPVAMLDREMRYLQVSDRWIADYLPGRAQMIGCSHYEIFPDVPERWKEVHRRCLEGETLRADEDRWDGQDGPHWARWEVRPWKTAEGTVGGILILAEDITRRKQMEEALSMLSQKLINSQEQERARIGRELHDDIVQRLALLAVELEHLQQDLPDSASEQRAFTGALCKRTTELATDVQSMSHELHSSNLEYLGIVAAMRSFCRELSTRQKVEIDFKSDNVPIQLPPEISLCLFRVLQEALRNSLRHSGVRHFDVQLQGDSREIQLDISDSGRGFVLEAAIQTSGLGLISMRERVRLVNGTIAIESKPMSGTKIHVSVPVKPEANQRVAG
jgi:PAS domain S-box-containing protein